MYEGGVSPASEPSRASMFGKYYEINHVVDAVSGRTQEPYEPIMGHRLSVGVKSLLDT